MKCLSAIRSVSWCPYNWGTVFCRYKICTIRVGDVPDAGDLGGTSAAAHEVVRSQVLCACLQICKGA